MWITLTPSEADTLLGPKELEALLAHLGVDGRADLLAQVIDQVRGYCATKGELGPAGTIPPECKGAARSLYRMALLASLPTGGTITPMREKEYDNAMTYLKQIGKGEVGITRPDPVATSSAGLSGSVGPSIKAGPARELNGSGV